MQQHTTEDGFTHDATPTAYYEPLHTTHHSSAAGAHAQTLASAMPPPPPKKSPTTNQSASPDCDIHPRQLVKLSVMLS